MVDLIKKTLQHPVFGKGKIIEVNGSQVKVEFDNRKYRYKEFSIQAIIDKKNMQFHDKSIYSKKNLAEIKEYLANIGVSTYDGKESPLTIGTLAELGLLDDFYDFYTTIQAYYENKYRLAKENNTGKYPYFDTAYLELYKYVDLDHVKQLSDPFFKKYSFLFVDQPYIINPKMDRYLNLSTFSMEQIPKGFKVVRIGLKRFLEKLQWIILQTVIKDPRLKLHIYGLDEADKRLNFHIYNEIEKLRLAQQKEKPSIKLFDLPVYVFDSLINTRCKQNNHPVVPKRVIVRKLSDLGEIVIPVHYCETCNRYMIGRATLTQYDKAYQKILVRRIKLDDTGPYGEFDLESKLHLYGYNAIDGELTDDERHELLSKLLSMRLMTYFEICSTIEQNIRMFQGRPNFALALKKWSDDLLYLGEYIKSKDAELGDSVNHKGEIIDQKR